MLKENASIAVVGAGAIGGVTASFLRRSGWNPELVCKNQETLDRARSRGLHISGVRGEHHIRLNAVKNISDMSGPKDIVFLATRATDCLQAAIDLIPFLRAESIVVSLQNGICEFSISEVLGRERVMGCVVGWGASNLGPGMLKMTVDGEFVIGNIDQRPDENLPFVRKMLNTVAPTRISDNIIGDLYSKLIMNSCISSLGAIVGENLGSLLANKKVRNIFMVLMREAMSVAEAMDIKVEPVVGGRLDYYQFLRGHSYLFDLKRHLYIRAMGLKYRRVKSSTLRSLEQGRKTEIDYLNGYIVDQGKLKGVGTPLNRAVVEMVKQIEAGNRKIGRNNLDDPVFKGI
jgi:2-dehydropantoate 2-reductase